MRESRTYGSVRGALSNERPYRNPELGRGTFAATFFLATIAALELEGIRLEDL
jgi:hypothetical protein